VIKAENELNDMPVSLDLDKDPPQLRQSSLSVDLSCGGIDHYDKPENASSINEQEEQVVGVSATASLSSSLSINPFDQISDKIHFPDFETSMRLEDKDENVSPNRLDWSIDTLAQLQPMSFSPIQEQPVVPQTSTDSQTQRELHLKYQEQNEERCRLFFEDKSLFHILETPSPIQRKQQEVQVAQTNINSSASPQKQSPGLSVSFRLSELHERCRRAINEHEKRLREREKKMSRLNVTRVSLEKCLRTNKTPLSSTRTFSFGVSPIPFDRNETPSLTSTPNEKVSPSHENVIAVTPVADTSMLSSIDLNDSDQESPSFNSIHFSQSELSFEPTAQQEMRQNKDTHNTANSNTQAKISSLDTISLLEEMSISKRQQSFVASIEAEAEALSATSKDTHDLSLNSTSQDKYPLLQQLSKQSSKDKSSQVYLTDVYKEARAHGITEPTDQWEYVRILSKKNNPPTSKRK
jgi:hypothetical protein